MTAYIFGTKPAAAPVAASAAAPEVVAKGTTTNGRVVTVLNGIKSTPAVLMNGASKMVGGTYHYAKKVPGFERTVNAVAPYAVYIAVAGLGFAASTTAHMLMEQPEEPTWASTLTFGLL